MIAVKWYISFMHIKKITVQLSLCILVLASLSFLPISPDRATEVMGHSEVANHVKTISEVVNKEDESLTIQWSPLDDGGKHHELWETYLKEEATRPSPRLQIKDDGSLQLRTWAEADNGVLTTRFTLEGATLEEPLQEKSEKRLGDWLALVPPVVAVLLALVFQKILIALLVAVWTGVTITSGANPLEGIWLTLTDVLLPVVSDSFNLRILGFTFALVGMVSVVTRMGGTRGLIERISTKAKDARETQIATGLMGLVIFFDDYANTVVVGTAARKLTDSMRVSREKLAYIVDSTSAPIAGIALVSTWIGYEVGLFSSILPELHGVDGLPSEGYGLFFEALPMRFYCIFALLLVFVSAWMRRDMGPMLAAERRARRGGPVIPPLPGHEEEEPKEDPETLEKPGVPPRWWNAAIPISWVLFGTLGSIAIIGGGDDFSLFSGASWRGAFEGAEDHIPSILLYSALTGGLMAFILALSQGLLTVGEAVKSYSTSMAHLAGAGAILILAWAIKDVCGNIGTGNALVALVGESIPPLVLPLVVFVLSGLVAFFTGTSWGTMALLLPVAAPLAASLSGEALIVVACVGAVLDGAIWGDHCSPISDTTVLSSTATGCPHVEHVRTQIPYAMLAMCAAGMGGYLGISIGLPLWLTYLIGLGILMGGLLIFGGDPEAPETTGSTSK